MKKTALQIAKDMWDGSFQIEGSGELDGMLGDYEYLLHHIHIDDKGKEVIHHCLVYDHKANMFEQSHLHIKSGKLYVDGKLTKDTHFHIISGLEPTQEVSWSEDQATDAGIKLKKMVHGMTLKEKSKVW